MSGEVLQLNTAYMPVGIINWQDAITLWAKGKAEILNTYSDKLLHTGNSRRKPVYGTNDNFIHTKYDKNLDSWKTAFEMPAVIRLLEFVNPPKEVQFYKPFTRKNVYERDGGRCQYCGCKVSLNGFSFDHVLAKSRGGKTSWTNIVCCCIKCNTKKNNMTPSEANMKLIQKPYAPLIAEDFNSGVMNRLKGISKIINKKEWQDYIYWQVELKDD
jgi:hypothetical protein